MFIECDGNVRLKEIDKSLCLWSLHFGGGRKTKTKEINKIISDVVSAMKIGKQQGSVIVKG